VAGFAIVSSAVLLTRHQPAASLAWCLVGAPLAEEIVFRGGLQAALARHWAGRGPTVAAVGSVVAASLGFAVAHVLASGHGAAALTFVPSLLLGALYVRTGRVRDSAALHALFNACWLGAGAVAPSLTTFR
jgi:membrane protease YdiL (CAAX protease family)